MVFRSGTKYIMLRQGPAVTLILCIWTLTLISYAFAQTKEDSTTLLQLETPTRLKNPSPLTIPLTSIAHEAPLGDHPSEPLFTVVAFPEEWNKLRGRVPDQAIEAGIRYGKLNDKLILVAFAGIKPSSGHSITLNSVVQEGDQLFVHIFHTKPGLNKIVEPATTLPYHLVTLPKEKLYPTHILTFVFCDEKGHVLNQCDIEPR